jgi:hypothetical protein
VLFDELDQPTAAAIERLLAARGLEVSARPPRMLAMWGRRARAAVIGGAAVAAAGLGMTAAIGPQGLPLLAIGVVVAGAAVASAKRQAAKLAGLFRLRDPGAAAPTAERLLGSARHTSNQLGAPEVRSLFVEVSRELYRLTRRAEELTVKAPAGSSEEALARRILAAAPSLGERLESIARRLEVLDAALARDSESDILRALGALERRLAAAAEPDRPALEETRRELEAACDRRRSVEEERERLSAALCRMLATVRDLYRRARGLRTAAEQEAEAIAVALEELERG